MTITHTITRDDVETEITCEIRMIKASRGHRDRYGAPEEPDEPAEAEIEKVTPDIELTEAEEDAIREKAFDQADNDGREYERD